MLSKTKVRLNKKKCQQGMDGMNVEYVLKLDGMEQLYLPPEVLENEAENTIVKIECVGGKIKAYVNAVHCIRSDNVRPFGIADTIKLELVNAQIIGFIKKYLKKHLNWNYPDSVIGTMKIKALECNITLPCVKGCKVSDVIALFDLALDRTVVFRRKKYLAGYEKANTSCLYSKPKEYRLKIYAKSEEQYEKGNYAVEANLLRIEVAFIDRSLRRMYGDIPTLAEILSVQAVEIMCREYKRVLEVDLINRSIKPCLNYCVDQLFESLIFSEAGNEISTTIIKHRELIPDVEVLRKALKRWYRVLGKEDNSKQVIYHYRMKEAGFPEGVLKTIRAFHDAAG